MGSEKAGQEQQKSTAADAEKSRLSGLVQPSAANLEEPKPEYTCAVEKPPTGTAGGEAPVPPAPQYTCSVQKPPTGTAGG